MRIGIPKTSDFWVIQRLTKLLTRRERLVIFLTLGVRLALVVLDIVGLALVGVSVSLVSGTAISSKSVTGAAVSWLSHSGFQYPYAFFGFASVFFFVVKTLLAIQLNNFVLGRVARVEARKALQLFEQIADSNLDKLDLFSKPQLNTGLNEGFELSVSKLVMGISTVFGEVGLSAGIGLYLAFVDIRLFSITALFFLCLGWFMQKLVSSRTKSASMQFQRATIYTQTVVSDLYQNFRQLKSHGRYSLLVERFASSRKSQAQESAKLSALSVMPRYITEIALMLGFSLLLLQRSIAGADAFSATTLGIFIAGAFRILASLLPMQGSLTMLKQISGSSLLALELIDTFGAPSKTRGTTEEANLALDISLKKLSFSYPGKGKPLLKDLSLEIPFGSYLAIVGKSGSGKSSLADLILGLRTPSSGSVTIGGLPAADFIREHSGAIAYVPQKNHLLTGTLAQNVSLSESPSSINLDLVAKSLEQSGLGELQGSLPEGLDTMFGEGLRELSGGQAQRLGIARAIYQNAKIIIFDEATSALDAKTELEVLETIETMIGSRTIIAIAHRGAVMDHANTRVLLEAGQITLSQTSN